MREAYLGDPFLLPDWVGLISSIISVSFKYSRFEKVAGRVCSGIERFCCDQVLFGFICFIIYQGGDVAVKDN